MQNIRNPVPQKLQRYAPAEGLLQHSRPPEPSSPSIHGFTVPNIKTSFQNFLQPSQDSRSAVAVSSYSDLKHALQSNIQVQEQNHGYSGSIDAIASSPLGKIDSPDQQSLSSFSERGRVPTSMPPSKEQSAPLNALRRHQHGHNRDNSLGKSEVINQISPHGLSVRESINNSKGSKSNQDDDNVGLEEKEELDQPPAWSELKTKAGKERKRLPLACIACRRKKTRCSGEKPACKHCLRSRIPCVYKVTARKAAPRTDYMAMLDKRLKRMEERVIKMIPKEGTGMIAAADRANVRPPTAGDGKISGGKKRAAIEAFGPDLDDWAHSKVGGLLGKASDTDNSKVSSEGAKSLPTREIQEHLAEVFFDCLYGQSYHLLHKPSFMKKLR